MTMFIPRRPHGPNRQMVRPAPTGVVAPKPGWKERCEQAVANFDPNKGGRIVDGRGTQKPTADKGD